jgi:hypothetical protein
MDLFVVPTIGFDLLYAFVIVRLGCRDLVWINVTANPTAEWVARQITPGSTNRCEQVARHPGRTSSPLRPNLSFRYTQWRNKPQHGNCLIRTLRKIYGQGFAAGYPETEKLSEVLHQLNETSLSQLRRDHETGHLEHKIAKASK